MRHLALAGLALVAALALAACGGGTSPAPASSVANPSTPAASAAGSPAASGAGSAAACATAAAGATATVTVTIKDFKYTPQPVQAKVGDIVAWTNNDSVPHSATMDDGSCDTGQIAAGASGMLTFTAAGTYTYHCLVHPGQMKDVTVEVK